MTKPFLISILFFLFISSCNSDSKEVSKPLLAITHGVSVGDVTESQAVIWSRTNSSATMNVKLTPSAEGKSDFKTSVLAENDFTGKIKITGLKADQRYQYQVWFSSKDPSGSEGSKAQGQFRTAPSVNQNKPVTLAWGNDVGGQNVCRDKKEGFPIFDAINKENLDLFIGLGDMIYADGICTSEGRYGNAQIVGDFKPASDLKSFWSHWKYNRSDPGLKRILAKTPYFPIWDDHEVVNDFGPKQDTREQAPYKKGMHLLPIGLQSFLDYNPVAENPDSPHRLYRKIRWGRHLELFLLDTRQYRDANQDPDSKEHPKTLLGEKQLNWLKENLKKSNATWKVIGSSVPLSIPTGFPHARDAWANYDAGTATNGEDQPQADTGFENELFEILKTLNEINASAIFLTGDVHFAKVFRYTPFMDRPNFQFYEFVTGPMNSGIFPTEAFDTTFNPESLYMLGPKGGDQNLSFQQARLFFNYGKLHIDSEGFLTVSIHNGFGKKVYSITFQW